MNANGVPDLESLVQRDLLTALASADDLATAHSHKVHAAGYDDDSVAVIDVELDFVV